MALLGASHLPPPRSGGRGTAPRRGRGGGGKPRPLYQGYPVAPLRLSLRLAPSTIGSSADGPPPAAARGR
jgi:hypothetical protein